MKYYLAIKIVEIVMQATIWMKLENITVSERNYS